MSWGRGVLPRTCEGECISGVEGKGRGGTGDVLLGLEVLVLDTGLVSLDALHGDGAFLGGEEPCVCRRVGEEKPVRDGVTHCDTTCDDHKPEKRSETVYEQG